jgi:hypothetical protein
MASRSPKTRDWARRGDAASTDTDVTAPDGRGGRRHGLTRRWRRKALAVTAVLIVAFAAATARLLVFPVQGAPSSVSAIVMLAGPGNRLPVALRLAQEHRAPVLVVSQGWMGYGGPCPAPVAGVRIICFDPNPGNTRGEAEYVGQLAKRYGWHSILVVAIQAQAVRAQLLVGRCFNGQAYAVTAPIWAGDWPYQLAYGWGALLKAVFLVRTC